MMTEKLSEVREVKLAITALLILVAVTFTDMAIFGFSHANFMLSFSGWFSLGSAVIAVFLVIEAAKFQLKVKGLLGGRDPNLILKRLDDTLTDAERVFNSPQFLEMVKLLIPEDKLKR